MLTAVVAFILLATPPATLPGFHRSPWFDEQVREEWLADGVRVVVNAPAKYDPARPVRLVIYATPNGNTIEQTLGSTTPAETDWHFNIQHVAARPWGHCFFAGFNRFTRRKRFHKYQRSGVPKTNQRIFPGNTRLPSRRKLGDSNFDRKGQTCQSLNGSRTVITPPRRLR